jgi:tRNA G18 (ribose-2'-O)-methylase SpoU
LKKEKFEIFSVEQDKKSIPYYKLKVKNKNLKIALVFGNEINGVSKNILKKSDKILEIPMRGAMVRQVCHPRYSHHGKESLNVSVAAGIVLFGIKYLTAKKVIK